MPNPKYYQITLPSGSTQIWDEDKVNRNQQWLKDKGAKSEEVNQFEVTLPSGASQTWDADKYGRNIDWLAEHQAQVRGSLLADQTAQAKQEEPVEAPKVQPTVDTIRQQPVQQDTIPVQKDSVQQPIVPQVQPVQPPVDTTTAPDREAALAEVEARHEREVQEQNAPQHATSEQVAALSSSIDEALNAAVTESMEGYQRAEEEAKKLPFGQRLLRFIGENSAHHGDAGATMMRETKKQFGGAGNAELQSRISSLQAAKKAITNAERIINEADHAINSGNYNAFSNTFAGGAARGFGDKFFDVSTWDMGMSDMENATAISDALSAYESGTLTSAQQALLDAKAVELATNAYFGSYVGRGYKAGSVTAESIPFMLEMCINPASTIGEAATSRMARYAISRFGKEAAKKATHKALRAAGRAGADLAGAAIMAGTTGSMGVAAETMERMAGDVDFATDAEGKSIFAGVTPGSQEDFGTAFRKAFAGRTIENYSEMVGNYFAPVLGAAGEAAGRGLEKVGLGEVRDFLKVASKSDISRIVNDFAKHTQWHGTIGEYAEEVVGNIMNALVVGDMTLDAAKDTGVFNLDQNIDTFLGVALLGGVMSGIKSTGYRTPKYRARTEISGASRAVDTAFEGAANWEDLKAAMSEDPNAALHEVLTGDYTPEQRQAVLNYAKTLKEYEGVLDAESKRRTEQETPLDEVQADLETSYDNGYALATDEEMNDAKNNLEYQRQRIQQMLGLSDISEEQILDDADLPLEAEQRDAAMDYLNAKATYEGLIHRIQDDINERIAAANAEVDINVNQADGQIHPAELLDGRHVYITGGNVVVSEDGTIDKPNSTRDIIIRDVETGKKEFSSLEFLKSADPTIDPQEEKQAAAQSIREQMARSYADRIDGRLQFQQGDVYELTPPQGEPFTVQVVPNEEGLIDNGDGTVNVLVGSDPRIQLMQRDVVQQLADNTRLARLGLHEQQKAEKKAQEAEAARPAYNINDNVTVAVDGAPIRGTITDITADGIEFYSEVPINGRVMNVFPLEQFDPMVREHNGQAVEAPVQVQPEIAQEQGQIEQNEAQIAQETPVSEQPQGPAIDRVPKDEKGEPVFENAEVADTYQALLDMNEGDEAETVDTAAQMVENVQKELEKATKAKARGTSPMEIQRSKAANREQVKALQKKLDYWQKVAEYPEMVRKNAEEEAKRQRRARLAEARKIQEKNGRFAKEDAQLGEPLSFRDFIMRNIANGFTKFKWSDDATTSTKGLGAHLGFSGKSQEAIRRGWLLNNETGLYPEAAAEELLNAYAASMGVDEIPGMTTMDAFNELLDVLNSYDSSRSMFDAAKKAHEEAAGIYEHVPAVEDYVEEEETPAEEVQEPAQEQAEPVEEAPVQHPETEQAPATPMSEEQRTAIREMLEAGDGDLRLLDVMSSEEAEAMQQAYDAYMEVQRVNEEAIAAARREIGSTTNKTRRQIAQQEIDKANRNIAEALTPLMDQHQAMLRKYGFEQETNQEDEAPVNETQAAIQQAREEVNPAPTDAQKEAGNYRKGHVTVDGYDISIENAKGSTRSGVDAQGNPWETTMNNDYGYIRRTEGVDGDHIDVFLSDNPEEGNVFVVDQVDPETGEFDEHKVMYGFPDADAAREAYLANYSEGWKGLGNITEVTKDEFRKWIDSSHRKTKPFAEYKSVKPVQQEEDLVLPPLALVDSYAQIEPTKVIDKGKPGRTEILNAMYQANPNLVQFRNEQDQQNALADVVALARQYPELEISKDIMRRLTKAERPQEEPAGETTPAGFKKGDNFKYKIPATGSDEVHTIEITDIRDGLVYYHVGLETDDARLAREAEEDAVKPIDAFDEEFAYPVKFPNYEDWAKWLKAQEQAKQKPAPVMREVNVEGLMGAMNDLARGNTKEVKLSDYFKPEENESPAAKDAEKAAASPAPDETSDDISIEPAQYTNKKGKTTDMYLVKPGRELTKEELAAGKSLAKDSRGWYDREKGGFMMRSEDSAKALAESLRNPQAVADAQPLSLSDMRENGSTTIDTSEVQTPSKEEKEPVYKFDIYSNPDTGYTRIERAQVLPDGREIYDGNWGYSADTPREMKEILQNNNLYDLLPPMEQGILDRRIETHEFRKQAREEGVNGYRIGEKVMYKGKEATIHEFEDYSDHRPVLDSGLAPVIYEIANWEDISKIEAPAKDFADEHIIVTGIPETKKADERPVNPSGNKLVTDERYAELRMKMLEKLKGQMNMGIDPEILAIGTEMAVYHIEKGARKFIDYAKAMIADLSDAIRPYLKAFYNAVRDLPEAEQFASEMDSYEDVQAVDVANFDREAPADPATVAETVVKEREAEKQAEQAEKKIQHVRNTVRKEVSSQAQSKKEVAQKEFSRAVAADMLEALATGKKPYRSILDLRKRAESCGMTVDKDGRDDILLQELVEDGLVTAARDVIESKTYGGPKSETCYDAICQLYEMQPTIAQRSSQRIKMQQYSTPLPMSFVADMFAYQPGKTKSVLEPTAGNGMLVIGVPADIIHANELDETRLANLREQGFKEVTSQDGDEPFEGTYDAIIANPPFGNREARMYDGKSIAGLDPQIALNALDSMADDGRAAIIIGGNLEYAPNGAIKSKKAFFTYLYNHYNVKGIVDMDGKLYQRQGTTFPTMMILIDGRRSEEDRAQSTVYPPVKTKAVKKAETFKDLYDTVVSLLESKEKTNGTEILRTQQLGLFDDIEASGDADTQRHGGEPHADAADAAGKPAGRTGNKPSDGDARQSAGRPSQKGNGVPGQSGHAKVSGDEAASQPRNTPAADNGSTGNGEPGGSEPVANAGTGQLDSERTGAVGVPADGVGLEKKAEPKRREPKQEEKRTLTDEKLPYRPHNESLYLESVAPAAMVEAMDAALAKVEDEVGPIEQFVQKELGYESPEDLHNALAAEQIDSVAMAIYQMKKGEALIIGDQTGVGKGRQMAALIRWAVRQGQQPIFITQKADLFSDIYRDLVDIGSGDLNPFIFNAVETSKDKDSGKTLYGGGTMTDADGNLVYRAPAPAEQKKIFESGQLPPEYDFAVLTYSQVNTGDAISSEEAKSSAKEKGERTGKRGKNVKEGRATPKATFLRAIAKDNYLLLDESHTAAGDSNIGAYLQSIVKTARAVTFASATFAKRPDTMPLYALRTAMSQAKVDKGKDLISIIKKGGVTLQEIMSRALTSAGQMFRRERDMSDVKTDWETITDPETVKRARENYDKTITAFNAIIKFQEDYIKPLVEALDNDLAVRAESAGIKKGTNKMGVDNVPFASKTYNYTKQLMLALKTQAIVDRVDQEIKAGRHPVIALESTMESSYKDYAPGEVIKEPTFSASLLRGLDTCMQYTIKDENGKEQHKKYTPAALGEEGERAYYALREQIIESTKGIFISPLDAIISGLREKGYRVGELTGRNSYVDVDDNGRATVRRREDRDKKAMQRGFNNGELDVLILNKSASTGISLQAARWFGDRRQRSMIIAQPLSDINDYMQMIGRIDRTGQIHRGYYINLALPVPAEQRFNMMLATKLKSLNANTTTSQESDTGNVDAPDLLNKYGSKVVVEYLRDNPEIYVKMGEPLKAGEAGGAKVTVDKLDEYSTKEDDARRITGYVALLSTKEQEEFYNDVVARYNALIQYLNDTGTNDLKITVMPLRAKTLDKRISSEGVDPSGENPFARDAYVERVEMDVLRKPMSASEIRKTIESINEGMDPQERLKKIIDRLREEASAKRDAEDERYKQAKAKAAEEIAKRADVINAQKRTDEEKKEAIDRFADLTNAKVEATHKVKWDKVTHEAESLFQRLKMFSVGRTYFIPDNIGSDDEGSSVAQSMFSDPAIFLGYKVKDSNITASTTLAVFAPLDGRRRIEVKLSDFNSVNGIKNLTDINYNASLQTNLDNWDDLTPKEARKEGYIMTGNILQAIADTQDDYGAFPGQLISYTDIDGDIHDGILMPDKWNPGLLRSAGVPINAKMEDILLGRTVKSSDGKITIEQNKGYGGIYYLTVPKTKAAGGQYFDNPTILKLVRGGVFYPNRGGLRADVNAYNVPALVNELSRLGVRVQGEKEDTRRYREAFHGSPADFEAFDSAHIGDGEGHQAHGWGHYVSFEEGTGRRYAYLGERDRVTYNGPKAPTYYGGELVEFIKDDMAKGTPFEESKQRILNMLNKAEEDRKAGRSGSYWKNVSNAKEIAFIEELSETDFTVNEVSRNLYTVDIPDDTGDNYIDEDKNLSKAIRTKVLAALRAMPADMWKTSEDEAVLFHEPTLEQFIGRVEKARMDGERFYSDLSHGLGSKKAASDFLHNAGFAGIKYVGGIDGESAVIFNERDIRISKHHRFRDPSEISDIERDDMLHAGKRDISGYQKRLDELNARAAKEGADMQTLNREKASLFNEYLEQVSTSDIATVSVPLADLKGWLMEHGVSEERADEIVASFSNPFFIGEHNIDTDTEIYLADRVPSIDYLREAIVHERQHKRTMASDNVKRRMMNAFGYEQNPTMAYAGLYNAVHSLSGNVEAYLKPGMTREEALLKLADEFISYAMQKKYSDENFENTLKKKYIARQEAIDLINELYEEGRRSYVSRHESGDGQQNVRVSESEAGRDNETSPEEQPGEVQGRSGNEEDTGRYPSGGREGEDEVVRYRIREDEPPKKTGIGYKVFVLKNGALYPPMVANPGGAATPVGVWLDADAAPVVNTTKTGRQQVKAGGKGTQGGSGTLSFRPGWHLGTIPYAIQFNRQDEQGNKALFPKDFVWAEVEYANDVDYQDEAMSYGKTANGGFNNALAGLPKLPVNGSYTYRTNPDPKTDPWIITGAMKVNRLLTPSEVDTMVEAAGREPQKRQRGAVADAQIEDLNARIFSEADNTPAAVAEAVKGLGNALGVKVRTVMDANELTDENPSIQRRMRRAKGWYDTATGEVVVVVPNSESVADAKATVFHEIVAHQGLREMVGEENFNRFLDRVYRGASEDIRAQITTLARQRGWDFHEATEEYLANMAEEGFDARENRTFWEKVRDLFEDMISAAKLRLGFHINDRDLRYALWRSYQMRKASGAAAVAEDIMMQRKMQVGEYAPKRFRDPDEVLHDRIQVRDHYERALQSGLYQFREAVQDSMLSLRELMQAIAGNTPIEEIDAFENPYLAENAMSSMNKAEQEAYYKLVMTPLLEEIAKFGVPEQEAKTYMMAKHGLERNIVMAERYGREAFDADTENTKTLAEHIADARKRDYAGLQGLTGTDNVADAEQEATSIVQAFEGAHNVDALWDKTNAATKASLQKLYDCGLLTREGLDAITKMYDFYVPLRGFDATTSDEVYGYLTDRKGMLNSPLKKAEGRSSQADDPIAYIASMADTAIMQGNRNKMKQRFLNFALNHPSDLVSVSSLWLSWDDVANEWKPVFADLKPGDSPEEVERKVEAFNEKMKALAETDPDHYKGGKDTVNIPYKIVGDNLKEHQVLVKRGGRTYVLTINGNPRAAQALNGLTNPDTDISGFIGSLIRGGQKINRALSSVYTTRNPEFVLSNFLRDMFYSNLMNWVKESPAYAIRFHKNVGRFVPSRMFGLFKKWENGTLDEADPIENLFKQFMLNGGETGYTTVKDLDRQKKDLSKQVEAYGKKMPVKNAMDFLGQSFDIVNRGVENCARFAAFVTSREMGRTIQRSIYDAKEVSVNFNKKGAGDRFVNAAGQTLLGKIGGYSGAAGRLLYVFWNAGVQGLTNFGRAVKNHPYKAAAEMFALFALGAAVAALAGAGGDGDDDDENAYYNLPEYVRRSNICFRVGKSWITIPLPIEFRGLYGLGELMVGVVGGKENYSSSELAYQIGSQVSQVLPLDMLEGGGGISPFIPSAAKPVVEAYIRNKSWSGVPIYKDTYFNKNMPEWTKAYKSANRQLVELAETANRLSGGDEYTKGAVDLNPARIEYLLSGYFGGYETLVNKLIKMGETAVGAREFEWRNMLIASRVVKSGDERTAHRKLTNEYWNIVDKAEKVQQRLRGYENRADEGDEAYESKLEELENSPEYLLYEICDEYKPDIDAIRKDIKEETDPEVVKELEAEMYDLMRQMVDAVHESKNK